MKRLLGLLCALALLGACQKVSAPSARVASPDATVTATPDAAPPEVVAVRLTVPGASSAEVEALLIPLEKAAGTARVESLAVAGAGWLRAEVTGSRELTLRALADATPRDVRLEAVAAPSGREPRVRYTISSTTVPMADLGAAHDRELATRLERVPGVLDVRACGGAPPEWRVEVDPAQLRARGVALAELVAALEGVAANDLPDVVLRGGVRLRDLAVVGQSFRPRCFAHGERGRVLLGEVVVADASALAAAREQLVDPAAGMELEVLPEAPPLVVDLPPGVSDEQADRVLRQLADALPGAVVSLDRSPGALPRLGSEIHVLGATRRAIDEALRRLPELRGPRSPSETAPPPGDEPELVVRPDPQRLAAAGLATRDVELAVAAAREGIPVGHARVWLPGGLTPDLPVGATTLGSIATLEQRLSPSAIRRRAGQRVTPMAR